VEGQTPRKSDQDKRKPTPDQARMLERTVRRCRQVSNAALGERREAWRQCGVSVSS
jgi:hypothetical protein